MKRALTIAAVADLVIVSVLLHISIKDWLWTRPWWHSFLVAVPTIALAVIAFVELRHSEQANELRKEANRLRGEAINYQKEANELRQQEITLGPDNARLPNTEAHFIGQRRVHYVHTCAGMEVSSS